MSRIVKKGSLCHFCGITVYRSRVIRLHHMSAKTSARRANSTDGRYIRSRVGWYGERHSDSAKTRKPPSYIQTHQDVGGETSGTEMQG